MKKLKVMLLGYGIFILCFGVITAKGQTNARDQKYGTEEDYRRLFYLNTQYIQSYIKSDTATHNSLLWADDFIQQGPSGNLIPKKQLELYFGKPRFDKIEFFYADDVIVQFITNDAAMVYATTPLRLKGEAVTSWSRYNDVYIKRNGEWKCVSANIADMPKPGDVRAAFSKVAPLPQIISYHPGTEADRDELKQLNAKHAEAFARSKSELLKDVLADDYTLLESNGMLYKKTEVLEQVKTSAKGNTIENFKIENLVIRFVAADVAMIHAAIVMELKGGTARGTQYNDIYVKRGGKWVCVAGNNASIASL